jgi:hypothetical protein
MSAGLLISRQNKIKLHKIAVTSRNPDDILKSKQYRNLLNVLIRASKKLYFNKTSIIVKGTPKEPGNF